MRRYILTIVAILLCAISIYGDDDKAIKDVLLKYNYGIIKMGRSGEVEHFKSLASYDVAIKIQVWFESWKFSNLTLIADINDLRFSPIAYNENNATIRTMENWTYGYANLVTRDYALEPRDIFYKMHYTLQKHNGEWMIVAIEILEGEEFVKPNIHEPTLKEKEVEPQENIGQGKIETH